MPWVSSPGTHPQPEVDSHSHTRTATASAGRHHDNYTIKHTRARLAGQEGPEGSTHAGQENSQRIGSEVLLYTEGNTAMDVALSFPESGMEGTDIANYICRPELTMQLGKGTLLIFKAADDAFFCHEAAFRKSNISGNPSGLRMCFVYRWLTVGKVFRTASPHKYKNDP